MLKCVSATSFIFSLLGALIFTSIMNRYIKTKISGVQLFLFVIYITIVLLVTVFGRPIGYVGNMNSFSTMFNTYNMQFGEKYKQAIFEIVSNIILFIPFGVILARHTKPGYTLVTVVVFSLMLECIQLLFRNGIFEIADVINNSVGGLIGVYFCQIKWCNTNVQQ